eukprot:Pgem_evm2s1741
MILRRLKIPFKKFYLLSEGKILKDTLLVAASPICPNCTVDVRLRVRGGQRKPNCGEEIGKTSSSGKESGKKKVMVITTIGRL